MRTIKAVHKAVYEPIADLVTHRAMPSEAVVMNQLDPFLFLNHHGWQEYPPQNKGLPFGPHPHRGFETVTFILEGDLLHKDSSGGGSVIKEGGVQWMTAGSGLIHAEVSSDAFKQTGGPMELLQLWVNLPAAHKMTAPNYTGLQKEEIPVVQLDAGKIQMHVVAGEWSGIKGPIVPFTDLHLSSMSILEGGAATLTVPAAQTILLYVVKGEIHVNGADVSAHHLVEFDHHGQDLAIIGNTDAVVLFGYATPFKEPVVAYGPFVMNTREEITQAYDDYNRGKMGRAEELL